MYTQLMRQTGHPAAEPPDVAAVGGQTGRRAWRLVVTLLAAMAVGGGTFKLVLVLVPGARPERVWSAADGTPPPSEFLFVMFPMDDNVALYDAPGGKKVGLLRRALGNDIGELASSQWIAVPPGGPGQERSFVRAEDLRYLSAAVAGTAPPVAELPLEQRVNYVAALAAAYRSRAPHERRQVTYMVHLSCPASLARECAVSGEGRYVSLDLKSGKNRRQFFARVTPEKAVPLAIDRIAEGSMVFYAVVRWIVAGCLAAVAFGLVVVGAGGVWRRLAQGLATLKPKLTSGGPEPH